MNLFEVTSKTIIPKQKMSTPNEYSSSNSISGAMYSSVPQIVMRLLHVSRLLLLVTRPGMPLSPSAVLAELVRLCRGGVVQSASTKRAMPKSEILQFHSSSNKTFCHTAG